MTYSNRLVWPQQWHTQTRCADGLLLLHIYSADYLYVPAVVNCELGSTSIVHRYSSGTVNGNYREIPLLLTGISATLSDADPRCPQLHLTPPPPPPPPAVAGGAETPAPESRCMPALFVSFLTPPAPLFQLHNVFGECRSRSRSHALLFVSRGLHPRTFLGWWCRRYGL